VHGKGKFVFYQGDGLMALWLVRAGRQGERENLALEKNIVVIGWYELPDLSSVKTRDEMYSVLEEHNPEVKKRSLQNQATQVYSFVSEIKKGDIVALPLKQRPSIAFGRITGDYQYREDLPPDAKHTRPVKWLKEIPRSSIDQDLLYSFGAFMTVCRIKRNNAEERILAYLEEKKVTKTEETAEDLMDLEEIALDQIRTYVSQRFKGHKLTDLVASVLNTKGYKVRVAPEGPDGGVDILAGSGALGLDSPRLAVQVKSGDLETEIKTVRELQGAMKNFNVDQGLFVSWAGFKKSVHNEKARLFFEVRLWDSDDLLREVLKQYDDLPDEIQADLPLKSVWVLVPSSDETL